MNLATPATWERIVLFDGECAVCDATVTWILDHDAEARFSFAPLQGPSAAAIRARHPEIPANLDSIVVVERLGSTERAYWHSAAIVQIVRHLPAPWSWARIAGWVPTPLRDLGYRAFAAVRYRVFGKLEACRMPDPKWEGRFFE